MLRALNELAGSLPAAGRFIFTEATGVVTLVICPSVHVHGRLQGREYVLTSAGDLTFNPAFQSKIKDPVCRTVSCRFTAEAETANKVPWLKVNWKHHTRLTTWQPGHLQVQRFV